MKILILALSLIGATAFADGHAKLTWTHDGSATDGSIVEITAFTFYYGLQGGPLNHVLQYGPPAPLPWKQVGAMKTWSKILTDAGFTPGTIWCFAMSAWSGTEESAHTNTVCKTFSATPEDPSIIEIVYP